MSPYNKFKEQQKTKKEIKHSVPQKTKYPPAKLLENHNPLMMEESNDHGDLYKFRQKETVTMKKKQSVDYGGPIIVKPTP